MENSPQKPHAILVTYPLQGHVIPTVNLAIKLASRGFTITFVTTQSIHHKTIKAQSKGGDDDIFAAVRKSGLDIRYKIISDGLPVGLDRSLNHDQFMSTLLHVFSAHVEEAVVEIMKNGPPVSCLVADTFFVWPSMVARKYRILYVSFWTEPALVFTLYYHVDFLRLNSHFGCQDIREDEITYIPGVRSIHPKDLMSYLQDIDTTSVCHQIIFRAFKDVKNADFVICNTIQELEPDTISALNTNLPFFAIGPIFPTAFAENTVSMSLWSELDCTQWLNSRPPGSVLYISFGSYAHVIKNDLIEIANGLLQSGISFVWVLRPDIVSSEDSDPLPVGFKEQIGDRAMIIPWCCQRQVLSSPAIGGFLTHCGWNSILESIWCGVPLLCFPLLTDQFTNRKLVVDDWRVGINLCDRKPITRSEVSDKINRLMKGKSGDDFRKEIKVVKKTLENALETGGSSERNMEKFIKDLKVSIQKKCKATSMQNNDSQCNGSLNNHN